jgi:hypothetical protein
VIADNTAIINPRKAEIIWMTTLIFCGIVDTNAKIDAIIPEIGCVRWWIIIIVRQMV